MKPIPPTDIAKLAAEISGQPYQQALPCALPDRWIAALARDLRETERLMKGVDEADPHMEGPLLVALHVAMGRMQERLLPEGLLISQQQLAELLRVYQFYIEREVVTRLVGVPSDEHLTVYAALDKVIDDLPRGRRHEQRN